ncbi:YkyA family protein [Carnobacterium gallinarum]|uniref:YkyA family protein n=1 Tax=Carnobacterium gallinarum TaxID=2749 RepID=UPI0005544826|nr:YkyA family protein [Carnobacterium gallinarum]
MKYKKVSLTLILTLLIILVAACGNTEERAGAKAIAKQNATFIAKITTNLESYENLEEEMMAALSTDLKADNAVAILTKENGDVGKNFKARQKEITTVEKNMKQVKENLKTLTEYQEKKAVDVPETELNQSIQTLKQLEITYDLFYNYYQSAETAEKDFYQNYTSDISKEDLTTALSTINQTHGAAYQQLEVLYADLSSALVAMTNLNDAIDN